MARQTAEETLFVKMLLGSDEGLGQASGPIVFPIFGRGRVLTAFHGEELTAQNITRAARFLCAQCACEVKEQNPGMDMLLTAAWDDLLTVPQSPLPTAAAEETTMPPAFPSPPTAGAGEATPRRWLWTAIAFAVLLVLLTGLWALSTRPPRSAAH